MPDGPVDQLSVALEATEQVVAVVRDQQWSASTPCPEWNVRDLFEHLVTGNYLFASILRGTPLEMARQELSEPDGAPLSRYRDAGASLLAAFRMPGVLEQVFTVPVGAVPGVAALHLRMTEVLVHGWDLARATGQLAEFPDDLAEQELIFSRRMLADMPPGRAPFAPPQPVSDDAPAIVRLAACLGRDVTRPLAVTRCRGDRRGRRSLGRCGRGSSISRDRRAPGPPVPLGRCASWTGLFPSPVRASC
jgi:uncharacterized protein (TIGR03086 family)